MTLFLNSPGNQLFHAMKCQLMKQIPVSPPPLLDCKRCQRDRFIHRIFTTHFLGVVLD